MRISSATAIAGCVSLSWMATLSGRARQSSFVRRKRATMSASEQQTRKYSCTKPQRLAGDAWNRPGRGRA